jgi:ribosomal protein S8
LVVFILRFSYRNMVFNNSLSNLASELNVLASSSRSEGSVRYSKTNHKLLCLLFKLGLLSSFRFIKRGFAGFLHFKLRLLGAKRLFFKAHSPVINGSKLRRVSSIASGCVSRRTLRVLVTSEILVVSTSRGILLGQDAVRYGLGGRVLLVIT